MMNPVITAVVLLAAFAPACAQAQGIGLVGDVVGGAIGAADTAVRDVVGGPRRGYERHGYRHRRIQRRGHRYCR